MTRSCLALLLVLLFLLRARSRGLAPHSRHAGDRRHSGHSLHLGHCLFERVIADPTAAVCGRMNWEDLADFPAARGGRGVGEFLGGGKAADS